MQQHALLPSESITQRSSSDDSIFYRDIRAGQYCDIKQM